MCLPFEVGIHLSPLGLVETVEEKLRQFKDKRGELVESFLSAYPRLCQEAAGDCAPSITRLTTYP